MDLYDDLDTKQRAGQIEGWSSGIKMLQTQLAIKKATVPLLTRKQDPSKKPTLLTPVINLKNKKDSDDLSSPARSAAIRPSTTLEFLAKPRVLTTTTITQSVQPVMVSSSKMNKGYDWDFVDEYDPMWPNEYDKLVKGKREKDHDIKPRNREREDRGERKRGRGGSRFAGGGGDRHEESPPAKFSGFGGRVSEEDSYHRSPPPTSTNRNAGAAIAPPPSLQEDTATNSNSNGSNDASLSSNVTIPYGASSVAAKIMARYGFKDGQGLGKSEQGMSMALQVEKTSKRGGRIIHEKELFLPPPPPTTSSPPPAPAPVIAPAAIMPAPTPPPPIAVEPAPKAEPSITEIMKSPSKVVLLRNMVGPGDVDNDLEPEVKDECNTKYGDVNTVVIHELHNVEPEESVRIFVEFRRIESAIKAVVDLNGRFFGGRQVRAGFYDFHKFKNMHLM